MGRPMRGTGYWGPSSWAVLESANCKYRGLRHTKTSTIESHQSSMRGFTSTELNLHRQTSRRPMYVRQICRRARPNVSLFKFRATTTHGRSMASSNTSTQRPDLLTVHLDAAPIIDGAGPSLRYADVSHPYPRRPGLRLTSRQLDRNQPI